MKVYQVNNPVTFSRKPIESEEFLNQMFGALGIIISRHSKERLRKRESYTNRICPYFPRKRGMKFRTLNLKNKKFIENVIKISQ